MSRDTLPTEGSAFVVSGGVQDRGNSTRGTSLTGNVDYHHKSEERAGTASPAQHHQSALSAFFSPPTCTEKEIFVECAICSFRPATAFFSSSCFGCPSSRATSYALRAASQLLFFTSALPRWAAYAGFLGLSRAASSYILPASNAPPCRSRTMPKLLYMDGLFASIMAALMNCAYAFFRSPCWR